MRERKKTYTLFSKSLAPFLRVTYFIKTSWTYSYRKNRRKKGKEREIEGKKTKERYRDKEKDRWRHKRYLFSETGW